jgi:hypothetical protein
MSVVVARVAGALEMNVAVWRVARANGSQGQDRAGDEIIRFTFRS